MIKELTGDEVKQRAEFYYNILLDQLGDYTNHMSQDPGHEYIDDSYPESQTHLIDALGSVLGYDRDTVIKDKYLALGIDNDDNDDDGGDGGENDD